MGLWGCGPLVKYVIQRRIFAKDIVLCYVFMLMYANEAKNVEKTCIHLIFILCDCWASTLHTPTCRMNASYQR